MTEFVTSLEGVAEPKTKLIGLVAGILLFISVFVPWASVSYMVYSISFSGLSISGAIGAIGIIAGLICALAVFLANPKVVGIVHIAAGALALLVMLAVWFSQPVIQPQQMSGPVFPEGFPREEWERTMRELGQQLSEMVQVQVGFFLYILSCIAVILGGLLEVRGKASVVTQTSEPPQHQQFCTGCGTLLRAGAAFCSRCGKPRRQ